MRGTKRKKKKLELGGVCMIRTERNIVIAFYWNVLGLFDIVDALEDGQTMTNTRHPHSFEVIVEKSNQSLADNLVLCRQG